MAVPTGLRAGAQLEVCKEQVEWARAEKRTFLRQRIEARLAMLHLGAKDYPAALALISRLLTEARRRTAPARSPAGPTCAWLQKALRALRRWAGRRGVLCDQRRRVLCMGGAVLGNAGHCVGRDCNGLDQLCIVHGDAPALVDIGTVQQACWRSDNATGVLAIRQAARRATQRGWSRRAKHAHVAAHIHPRARGRAPMGVP